MLTNDDSADNLYEEESWRYAYFNMKDLGAPPGSSGPYIPGYDVYMLLGVIGLSSVVIIIVKRSRQFKTHT